MSTQIEDRDLNELRKILGKPIKNPSETKTVPNDKDLNELRKILGKPLKEESAVSELQNHGIDATNNDEYTYGERAIQGARAFGGGIGGMIDTAANANPDFGRSLLAPQADIDEFNKVGDIEHKWPIDPNQQGIQGGIKKLVKSGVDKIAGQNLEADEDDSTGQIIQGTGDFLSSLVIPGSGLVKAGKAGLGAATKLLAKEGSAALGASTVLNTKPKFTDEGSVGRGVEDFADALLGGRAGNKLSGKASKIASDLYKTTAAGNLGKSIKEYPLKAAGRLTSKFSNPNSEVLKLAKKHNIDLPVNVGLRNTPLNSLHNNFLKSMFAAKSYRDIYKKADEQMFNKVKSSIDTLGIDNVPPNTASARFRDFLSEEKKLVNDKVEELYSDAVLNAGKGEKVIPENSIKAINEFSSLLNRDIQAPDTLKVSKILGKLADSWGLLPKNNEAISALKKNGYDNPELLSKIFSQLSNKNKGLPSLEIGRLNEVRQELGKMTYDQDLRGATGLLSSLRKAVTKDIESSTNPEFINKWKEANRFYRKNVVTRIQSDLAHSMLTGEAPKDAFDAMSTLKGINHVEKIAGETEKGQRVFSDLKKAKVRELLKDTIDGSYEDGTIRKAAFSKIFQKGEKNQEVLQKLLGKSEYDKLSDISKISEEFSKSGKELLNTSGTTPVAADYERIKDVAKSALKLVFGGVSSGYSVAGSTGAFVATGAAMATPYLLSKLVSNPVFVREARIYALARKAAKEKQAQSVLKKLIKMSDSEARRSAVLINKESSEEEDQ